jgi:hypothetical protein
MIPGRQHNLLAVMIRLALGALLLVCGLLLAPLSRPDLRQDYNNACAWWRELPSGAFDSLSACPADMTAERAGPTAHPPSATLVILPLAILPWPLAYHVWIVLGCIAVTATWLGYRVPLAACAATLPLWIYGLSRGTLEPMIFLLLALALSQTGRPRLRAALIGIAAACKVYPVLLLAAPLLRRRYGDLAVAVACGAGVSLLAELILGPGTTLTWIAYTPGNMLRWITKPDNVSLVRVLWSVLKITPGAISLALYAALTIVLARRRGWRINEQSLLPIMLLSTPLVWSHYLGHLTLMPLSRSVTMLLALGSSLLLLTSMDLLPISSAAAVYTPLLAGLLLAWYQSLSLAAPEPELAPAIS